MIQEMSQLTNFYPYYSILKRRNRKTSSNHNQFPEKDFSYGHGRQENGKKNRKDGTITLAPQKTVKSIKGDKQATPSVFCNVCRQRNLLFWHFLSVNRRRILRCFYCPPFDCQRKENKFHPQPIPQTIFLLRP